MSRLVGSRGQISIRKGEVKLTTNKVYIKDGYKNEEPLSGETLHQRRNKFLHLVSKEELAPHVYLLKPLKCSAGKRRVL